MLLTCPKCASRFSLPAEVLAPEGKKVKCSSCDETWFQLPDPDELLEELAGEEIENLPEVEEFEDVPDIEEDIPDAVKPVLSESLERAKDMNDDSSKKGKGDKKILDVVLSGLLICCIFISPLLVFKGTIIKAWPESRAFYKALGMGGKVPAEGVVFDQMQAEFEDDLFILTGQLINLTSKNTDLPLIEVALKGVNNKVIGHHYIRMPKKTLKAEEILPIKAEFKVKGLSRVHDVSVHFVLRPKNMAKTASKADDNTQVPHEGG